MTVSKSAINDVKEIPNKFVLLTHRSITDDEDTDLSKFNKLYYYSSKNVNSRNLDNLFVEYDIVIIDVLDKIGRAFWASEMITYPKDNVGILFLAKNKQCDDFINKYKIQKLIKKIPDCELLNDKIAYAKLLFSSSLPKPVSKWIRILKSLFGLLFGSV